MVGRERESRSKEKNESRENLRKGSLGLEGSHCIRRKERTGQPQRF